MYPNPNPGQMKRSCRALRYMYAYATITQHIALLHWMFEVCAFNFMLLPLILSISILAPFSRHPHRQPIFNPQRETTADREAEESHGRTGETDIHGIAMIYIHRRHTHLSFQIFQDTRLHDRPIQLTSRAACRKASMSECSKSSNTCGRYVSWIRIVPFIHSPSVFDL